MKNYEFDEGQFEEAWNSSYKKIPDKVIKKSWERFRLYLDSKAEKDSKKYYSKVGFAAALLLLFLTSYFFVLIKNPVVTIDNFSQLDKEVMLPDGSLVLLKPSAEIRFKEEFRNSRDVELQGEAFFEVVKDSLKEFKVTTASTITRVLGTSFSVVEKEEGEDVEISLFTGRIEVSGVDKMSTWNLVPGEMLLYSGGKARIEKFDNNLSFGPGEAFIDIDNLKLEKLFAFLEKRFDVDLRTKNSIEDKRVTLRINRRDSLQHILKILSTINHTTYEVNLKTEEIQQLSSR